MKPTNDKGMSEIITKVKERREALGFSFQDLADLTNMSKSTLQRYETGAIKNLPLSKLGVLAKALNTTPAYLMGWEEKEPASVETDELDVENDKLFKSLPESKKQEALNFLRFLQGK